jgi:hypothetical protein
MIKLFILNIYKFTRYTMSGPHCAYNYIQISELQLCKTAKSWLSLTNSYINSELQSHYYYKIQEIEENVLIAYRSRPAQISNKSRSHLQNPGTRKKKYIYTSSEKFAHL